MHEKIYSPVFTFEWLFLLKQFFMFFPLLLSISLTAPSLYLMDMKLVPTRKSSVNLAIYTYIFNFQFYNYHRYTIYLCRSQLLFLSHPYSIGSRGYNEILFIGMLVSRVVGESIYMPIAISVGMCIKQKDTPLCSYRFCICLHYKINNKIPKGKPFWIHYLAIIHL